MIQLYKDLWQTKLQLAFNSVPTHAYFLRCSEGNVLFYNTSHDDEILHMSELAGIKYQYLSHRDEAGESLQRIKKQFDSELCCHIKEEHSIAKYCSVDISFTERTNHFSGIDVIPTPGHTEGSISFLYQSPHGLTYLFTGDTLFQSYGQWGTLVFPGAGGSTEALTSSLLIYKELTPNVVISSAFSGNTGFMEVTKKKWREDIEHIIDELNK